MNMCCQPLSKALFFMKKPNHFLSSRNQRVFVSLLLEHSMMCLYIPKAFFLQKRDRSDDVLLQLKIIIEGKKTASGVEIKQKDY